MKEKIKHFLKDRNLTAAQLADQIGVQRSSVSHILSGRNKPSADFITKFLQHYPDINANWLFGMADNMFLTQRLKSGILFNDIKDVNNANDEKTSPVSNNKSDELKEPLSQPHNMLNKPESQDKKVRRIVYFYDDFTFTEYFPQ